MLDTGETRCPGTFFVHQHMHMRCGQRDGGLAILRRAIGFQQEDGEEVHERGAALRLRLLELRRDPAELDSILRSGAERAAGTARAASGAAVLDTPPMRVVLAVALLLASVGNVKFWSVLCSAAGGASLASVTLLAGSFGPLVYLLGGWSPPLGIALRADGPAVAMILAVAGVVCGIGAFARADFGLKAGQGESRAAFAYWLLLLAVWLVVAG